MPDDTTEDAEGYAAVTTYPTYSKGWREGCALEAQTHNIQQRQHATSQHERDHAGDGKRRAQHSRRETQLRTRHSSLRGSGLVCGLAARLSAPCVVTGASSWDWTSCMHADIGFPRWPPFPGSNGEGTPVSGPCGRFVLGVLFVKPHAGRASQRCIWKAASAKLTPPSPVTALCEPVPSAPMLLPLRFVENAYLYNNPHVLFLRQFLCRCCAPSRKERRKEGGRRSKVLGPN